MRIIHSVTLATLIIVLFLISPISAIAAPFEFSVTAKKAFDSMISSASRTTAAQLNKQYTDLKLLQNQDLDWDKKISTIHYSNEENDIAIRKKIKELDTAKIKQLETDVLRTKDRYKPLFELYDSEQKQLKLAKSFKNKGLTAIMNARVDLTKEAVQIAKQDIRNKEDALKSKKADVANKTKQIRAILSENDTIEVKIRAAKSSISTLKKHFSTEVKVLNQVVRKGDSTATQSSFTRMLSYQRQINEQKSKIHSYEGQIGAVITKANKQLTGK